MTLVIDAHNGEAVIRWETRHTSPSPQARATALWVLLTQTAAEAGRGT